MEKGVIKPGTYLLIESLDRLSRNEVDEAFELFMSIIRRGITIVTLTDEQVFSKERIKQDKGISLIISIAQMARAHDESAIKSKRIAAAWKAKRASGQILTSIGPAWLKLSDDRKKWLVLPDKAKTVRHVFDLATKGYGTPTIARMLNAEGSGTLRIGAPWGVRTVYKLLKDSAVIGTFYPKHGQADEPIEDYYPAVITKTQFHHVQDAITRRRHIGGPASQNETNILAGLLFCGACGGRMRILGATGSGTRKYRYIHCQSAFAGAGCTQGRHNYRTVELSVLALLGHAVTARIRQDEYSGEDPNVLLEAERDELQRRLDNLIDALEDVPTPAVKARINETQAKLDAVSAKMQSVVPVSIVHEIRAEAAELIAAVDKGKIRELGREERLRLRAALKQFVARVDCSTNADGAKQLAMKLIGGAKPHVDETIVAEALASIH